MDILKEREAFEIQFRNTKQYISILHFIEMGAAGSHQDIHSVFQRCDFNEDEYAHSSVQSGWSMWQAAKAEVVSGWISVKDKLPPANILVLGMSQTRSNIFNIYNVMALDEFEEAEVTHWMPLPEAPQEPANED